MVLWLSSGSMASVPTYHIGGFGCLRLILAPCFYIFYYAVFRPLAYACWPRILTELEVHIRIQGLLYHSILHVPSLYDIVSRWQRLLAMIELRRQRLSPEQHWSFRFRLGVGTYRAMIYFIRCRSNASALSQSDGLGLSRPGALPGSGAAPVELACHKKNGVSPPIYQNPLYLRDAC